MPCLPPPVAPGRGPSPRTRPPRRSVSRRPTASRPGVLRLSTGRGRSRRDRGRSVGLPSAWTRSESAMRHKDLAGTRSGDTFIPDCRLTRESVRGSRAMDDEMDLVDFSVDHARSRGASYAEARYERQDPENFILKNGVLDALYVGQDRGIGVRGLVDGALRVAATNPLSQPDARRIA